MKFELKKAEEKDFEEISIIYAEEYSKPPYNEPWTKKKALLKLKILSKYCDVFKILVQSKIIGFVVFNPTHWCPGEIVFGEEMAIKSEFQSKGIGSEVLNNLFEHYKKKGYKKWMGIVNRDGRPKKLYERLKAKESKDYFITERDL